jgi:hypothetical protein
LAPALAAAGYEGKQISAVGYDPRLTQLPALNDTYVQFTWLPFEAADNPTVARMTADIQQYGDGAALSLLSAMGWISADMLIEGLKATGADLTVDNLLATMNSPDFQYGDGIFSGQTTWPENHFYGAPCAQITHLLDGKYSNVVPLVCGNPVKNS